MAPLKSTKMRRAVASSVAIVGALGLLFLFQISDMNLTSYVQYSDSSNDSDAPTIRKGNRRQRHGQKITFNATLGRYQDEAATRSRMKIKRMRNGTKKMRMKEQNDEMINDADSDTTIDQPSNQRWSLKDKTLYVAKALAKERMARISTLNTQIPNSKQLSPACHPHFQMASSDTEWTWSNTTKFKRLYFYHARKAGGTSLADYLMKVAHHNGLEFAQDEWNEAEEPGTHEIPTFYVTHLREPVDRSVSHFKYQGRWNCKDLGHLDREGVEPFLPTAENAKTIESWNETAGHEPTACSNRGPPHFKLGECAVNCYTQYFSGLSCPQFNISTYEQHEAARARLLRYNMVIVLEKLSDPVYARAVEDFFGMPGVTKRRGAFCERSSHKANEMVPLKIKQNTMKNLKDLNKVDTGLYKELTDCLDEERLDNIYDFPKWDTSRFDNVTVRFAYHQRKELKEYQERMKQKNGEEAKLT